MQQKALLKVFPLLDSQDWAVTTKQDSFLVVNNHTLDEFIYEKINVSSWHLLDCYKARSLYVMPSTPQIIIGAFNSDSCCLEMLTQYAVGTLEKHIKRNLCQGSILEIFKNILKTVEFLVKKYGFFRLTSQMIRVTKSNHLLIWHNQNFSANIRQIALASHNIYEDYKTMINDLMLIFQTSGCRKMLENVRIRLDSEKTLSFQRFKIILQNQFRCHHRSKQKAIRFYQSPQFLKRKFSPQNAKRLATQQFHAAPNTSMTRFATSMNLEINSSSVSDYNSRKNSCNQFNVFFNKRQSTENDGQYYYEQHLLAGVQSASTFKTIEPIQTPKVTKSFFPKINSSTSQKFSASQTNQVSTFQGVQMDLKKKDIRQSANSLATTAFLTSITSSGKLKHMQFDENSSSTTSLSYAAVGKNLASSLGQKQTRKMKQLKQTFKVKASKIIEQKNEQPSTPTPCQRSMIKNEKEQQEKEQQQQMQQFEIEQQFDILLQSEKSSNYRPSSDLLELESQINNILLS